MSVDHNQIIIEVKNLSFFYGKIQVLKDINLDIHQGDYLGIIGPNGGGKTTLIKIILGLLKPSQGEITIFGQPSQEFRKRLEIGYVAQKMSSFDANFPLRAWDVVAMGRYAARGMFQGLTAQDREKINKALQEVHMFELKDRLIGDLSGGQQQRVYIARALAQEPKIIFLDEPTSGVDSPSQKEFYDLLNKLNKQGITLVLISHDIDVVAQEVTEVACINQGLIYHGNPSGLNAHHINNLYTQGMKFIVHKH